MSASVKFKNQCEYKQNQKASCAFADDASLKYLVKLSSSKINKVHVDLQKCMFGHVTGLLKEHNKKDRGLGHSYF